MGRLSEEDRYDSRVIAISRYVVNVWARGGICMISKRYAQANNKYVGNYNPAEWYITYLDASNLYSWAIIRKLPTYRRV